jgi:hypothetical protein
MRSSSSSGAYIRTANPKFAGVQNEDDEDRGLIGPSSAPLYSASFKSPNTPDDRSLGFPNTPRSAGFERNTELSHLTPSYQTTGYDKSPQLNPRSSLGGDLGGGEAEFSYLGPSTAYGGATTTT